MLSRNAIIFTLIVICSGCGLLAYPVAVMTVGTAGTPFMLPPPCPSLNFDLLEPLTIKSRINSKLSLIYQVSSVKPMSGNDQAALSKNPWECFLPNGLSKEAFEHALGGTLSSAGLAASEFIESQPNFILQARVLEQDEDISHGSQEKKVRLVVEYRLLLPGTEVERWASKIMTEHAYEQSSTKSGAMPDTLTSAFEAAVRQNLESLLVQLDAYEQQGI